MSSVSGLNDKPKTAIFLFDILSTLDRIFSTMSFFLKSLYFMVSSTIEIFDLESLAVFTNATVSFGKQLPPYPGPV